MELSNRKTWTVMIPTYNNAGTILETLNSINFKDNADVDVFVIDDGSKDNLEEVIKPITSQYPDRVHYFKKENGNYGSCLNYGIARLNSRFVSTLDSDDVYNPGSFDYVLNCLRQMDEDTDYVFVNCEWAFLNKGTSDYKYFSKTTKEFEYGYIKDISFKYIFTTHASIYSTRIAKMAKPLPHFTSYTDMVFVYNNLLNSKKVAYINKDVVLYKYCIRKAGEQSVSVERSVKNYGNFEIIWNAYLNFDLNEFDNPIKFKLARSFFKTHFSWFVMPLTMRYDIPITEKVRLLRSYYEQLEKYQIHGRYPESVFTPRVRILNGLAYIVMPVAKLAIDTLPITQFKACRYTKEGRRQAKLEGKPKKKAFIKAKKEQIANAEQKGIIG